MSDRWLGRWRAWFAALACCWIAGLAACQADWASPVRRVAATPSPGGSGGAGTGVAGGLADGGDGGGGARVVVSDFSLLDVNETSPRYDTLVSPRDYLGQISAWWFAEAT